MRENPPTTRSFTRRKLQSELSYDCGVFVVVFLLCNLHVFVELLGDVADVFLHLVDHMGFVHDVQLSRKQTMVCHLDGQSPISTC